MNDRPVDPVKVLPSGWRVSRIVRREQVGEAQCNDFGGGTKVGKREMLVSAMGVGFEN
jgi:hypothetical protein